MSTLERKAARAAKDNWSVEGKWECVSFAEGLWLRLEFGGLILFQKAHGSSYAATQISIPKGAKCHGKSPYLRTTTTVDREETGTGRRQTASSKPIPCVQVAGRPNAKFASP